jgi:hypothetical protein
MEHAPILAVAIVGMGQAGKTTLGTMIRGHFLADEPGATVEQFSASSGFRGLTEDLRDYFELPRNIPLDELTAEQLRSIPAAEMLADFAGDGEALAQAMINATIGDYLNEEDDGNEPWYRQLLEEHFSRYYTNPYSEDRLRNPAVNSLVSQVSVTDARSHINDAAARHMRVLCSDDATRPDAIIFDARNIAECEDKCVAAGLRRMLTFVLECPEDVVINRTPDIAPEDIEDEIKWLTARNDADRDRDPNRGRMARAEDVDFPIEAHLLLGVETSYEELAIAGMRAMVDRDVAIIIRTNELDLSQESEVIKYIMAGVKLVIDGNHREDGDVEIFIPENFPEYLAA